MSDPNRYWDEWNVYADAVARACLLLGALIASLAGVMYAVAESAGYLI